MQPGEGGVTLIRQLPWDQAATEVRVRESARSSGQPTHLLVGDTAYALASAPLTLGTRPDDGERRIDLEGDMPGVSRRHCSLAEENGQCVLRDYSRYGTFLNGYRIDGSAVLQVGDRIRVGTPGYEFRLITTETADGA
jgi:pSer/pThr/pTyr-binding forkhead associated (FHA) protein